jgi:hypothetical protein
MPLDPYYRKLVPLLGHIIVEHGNLEGDAGKMLARLNGHGDDVSAASYAAKHSFNEKIKAIEKLVASNVTDTDLASQFGTVLDEMTRVNRARNIYIHSEYLAEVNHLEEVSGFHYRQIKQMGDVLDSTDPNSQIAVHRVDIRELNKLVEDMIALGVDMRAVAEKYFDGILFNPPPSPKE